MPLTEEQQAVIEFEGDLVVQATAGSGKTSTVLEYCRHRPGSHALYLVYNRSMRVEAQHKFKKAGLKNVTVETMHSLAFRMLNVGKNFEVRAEGYKPIDLVEILGLNNKRYLQFSMVLAKHVLSFLSFYFNSHYRVMSQAQEDYLASIKSQEALQFATTHYDKITGHAWALFKKMYNKEIPILHDAYLKLFSMENKVMPHKYILVDESQDSSMVLVDFIHKQKANRILVGDPSQAIYSFRYCCDAMDILGFPKLTLSKSFRFGQGIADMGMKVLGYKEIAGLAGSDVKIIGAGGRSEEGKKQTGVLARNNLSLITQAILDQENGYIGSKGVPFGFEGGIDAYTFFSGTGLYDVLWLYCGKTEKIQDPFIKSFKGFGDLVEFQKDTDDRDLAPLTGIVSLFGTDLFGFIKNLRSEHTMDRTKCERLYTSCHRSKGMEYFGVEMIGFIDEWDVREAVEMGEFPKQRKKVSEDAPPAGIDEGALIEEINLHYVAITRAKKQAITIEDPLEAASEMAKARRQQYKETKTIEAQKSRLAKKG